MHNYRRAALHAALIAIGGALYVLVELLWRRRSHWSMFCVGGVCFALIGSIHDRFRRLCLPLRCGLCALAVSVVEFVSGCLINRRWRLNVWDYSHCRFQIKGQVCLLYTLLWGLLSAVAAPIYRACRRFLERRLTVCSGRR